MIKRIVGWVVLVPLSVVLIIFALANRQLIIVNFNPFVPSDALTSPGLGVPLFLVLFGVLLTGVVLGGVATWFAQGPHRRDERALRREAERLQRELDALRKSPGVPAALSVDDLVNS